MSGLTRTLLTAAVVGTWVTLGAGVASAEPPAPPGAPPSAGPCTERAAAGKSLRDEFSSCLGVKVSLDHLPAVGATATISAVVKASTALSTTVRFELPPQLAWVRAPAGFTRSSASLAAPERPGLTSIAQLTRAQARGASVTYSGVVRAVAAGPAQVTVNASAPDGGQTVAGEDVLYLTVADRGGVSRLGYGGGTGDQATVKATPSPVATRPPYLQLRSVPSTGLAQPVVPNAACDTRVIGNWGYRDQNNAWRNSMNFQVQLWDATNGLLTGGLTNGAGNYNLCFDSTRGRTIRVRFVSETSIWRVQTRGAPNAWVSGWVVNPAPGSTVNFGSLTSADPNQFRGLHAFDEANDAWLFIPKPSNACFDQKDAVCRQLRINWAADSTDGTYYSTLANDVHLAANDPNSAIVVVHEISHFIMDDVYNDAFPAAPNCSPHTIQGTTSAGCAWTEGFAEWLPSTVYNDPFFRWPNGASLDLENASWGNGWGLGDTTEGRIAGLMIDITDVANEAAWDRYGEGFASLWYTFTHHVSNTLAQFWSSRAADGFNVSDAGARADLYQNTVDYGFRDPLGNYAPLSRPTPTPHNYSYTTVTNYWSVVAVRPPAGSDFDLTLYDDRAQTAVLATSVSGGSTIDFVAVDSNLRAYGDYYPRVNAYSGAGTYGIELAQGAAILSPGSHVFTMGAANLVRVEDTYLYAGVPVTITVTPGNAGQDPELFLLGSDPNTPATWIKGRLSASASATSAGPGALERLTFTPGRSGWYGVVVTNKAGSGAMTLSRA